MRTDSYETNGRQHHQGAGSDLVVAPNFIRAVRDSGYISVSSALSELIDNSLQAEATAVDVTIVRLSATDAPVITVTDNGVGMDSAELESCLRFGGTPRFNDRSSFGRFGMGLPAASLSQSSRVEVLAWQAARTPKHVCLDVDEIVAGVSGRLRAVNRKEEVASVSGCTVIWARCDRIQYQRLAWLERALHRDLGRVFRRHLRRDLTLTINGVRVRGRDPLLLDSALEGNTATQPFELMRYELASPNGDSSFVCVRFSLLPVHAWHHLDNASKRRADIVGGGGVSILRADREVAFGWHLMGGKRKENYDDWWRCEIEFDPALDEQFGITVNKQGIRPSAQLREALEPELESAARLLNSRVRQAFEDIKFRAASDNACRIAEAADPQLPIVRRIGRKGTVGALRYQLSSGSLPSDAMLASKLEKGRLEVTLNVDHPAFGALYAPLRALADESGESPLRTAIELLLLSFARATVSVEQSAALTDLLTTWSDTYARMLQKT